MSGLTSKGIKGLAAELAAQIWLDGPSRSPDQVNKDVRERTLAMIRHTFELPDDEGQRQPLEPPAIGRLGDISVPVLVMVGELDVADIHAIAELLTGGIPESKKVILAGTAHLPNMERPAEFNRIVLDFLNSSLI